MTLMSKNKSGSTFYYCTSVRIWMNHRFSAIHSEIRLSWNIEVHFAESIIRIKVYAVDSIVLRFPTCSIYLKVYATISSKLKSVLNLKKFQTNFCWLETVSYKRIIANVPLGSLKNVIKSSFVQNFFYLRTRIEPETEVGFPKKRPPYTLIVA